MSIIFDDDNAVPLDSGRNNLEGWDSYEEVPLLLPNNRELQSINQSKLVSIR